MPSFASKEVGRLCHRTTNYGCGWQSASWTFLPHDLTAVDFLALMPTLLAEAVREILRIRISWIRQHNGCSGQRSCLRSSWHDPLPSQRGCSSCRQITARCGRVGSHSYHNALPDIRACLFMSFSIVDAL